MPAVTRNGDATTTGHGCNTTTTVLDHQQMFFVIVKV